MISGYVVSLMSDNTFRSHNGHELSLWVVMVAAMEESARSGMHGVCQAGISHIENGGQREPFAAKSGLTISKVMLHYRNI